MADEHILYKIEYGTNDSREEKYNLIAAKMKECERATIAELNRQLFRDLSTGTPYVPPTRRERLRWKWRRVVGYVTTVWEALCGRDLVIRDDDY